MGRRRGLTFVAVLLGGVFASSGLADASMLDRKWNAVQIERGREIWTLDTAAASPDTQAAVYQVHGSPDEVRIRAAVRTPRGTTEQDLDSGYAFFPTVAGSPLGGYVAVWYHEQPYEVRIAEMGPGGSEFRRTAAMSASGGNYSYGAPWVSVNERGDAVVTYLAGDSDGQRVMARFRPAGGSFGEPERVTDTFGMDEVYPRDVALGPDGTVVASVVQEGRAGVSVRPPGGSFGPVERVGSPIPEHGWLPPRVGVDGAGNVALAWVEAEPGDTGPVKVAFRPAGGRLGDPHDTALRTAYYGQIEMGVSRPGEALIAIEASSNLSTPGTQREGIYAVAANTVLGRVGPPRQLAGGWGTDPRLAMNPRGDAVIVWDECCLTLRTRRRPAMGRFGTVQEIAPPDVTGVHRGGRPLGATIDAFGNAGAAWVGTQWAEKYLGYDGPLINQEPPAVSLDPANPVAEIQPPDPPSRYPVYPSGGWWEPGPWPWPLNPAAPVGSRRSVDKRRPRLSISASRGPTRGRRRSVVVTMRCSERCATTTAGRVGRRLLGPVDRRLKAHRRGRVRLTLPRRRRGASMRGRLNVSAVDAAGNRTRRSLPLRLR